MALWGLSFFSPTVTAWFRSSTDQAPAVGGFLYVLLASTAAGLIVSAIRWAVVDRLYHWTGIREPEWDFRVLPERLSAFETLVEYHYRYYQFYANLQVAIVLGYGARLIAFRAWPGGCPWLGVIVLVVILFLVAGSRDTLKKYYARVAVLLQASEGDQDAGPDRQSARLFRRRPLP